jgi:redox-sensitive bicupin YhaK (pirin superfamily)
VLDVKLRKGEELGVPLPASYNALAVVADGRVTAGAVTARSGELVLFANDGERLVLSAAEDAHVIVLAGEPIREPIVQYGPFVMNSIGEIQQAIADVETGKFGPVPE